LSFLEQVDQAQDLLEKSKIISVRALKREFSLDDESLEDLLEELVDIRKIAKLDGKVLQWLNKSPSPPQALGERRQLTVMFCDLVGSTELAERLDPEEFGQILQSYREVCDEAANIYNGHIAQYLGDGVLVYFGFPHALEDAADRAIRAGLEIQKLLAEKFSNQIKARVGVHTGSVVVDPTAAGDKALALGSATNVAARVQSIAAPGAVLASSATLTNCRGSFEFKSLGEVELKGVEGAVEVFEMLAVTSSVENTSDTPSQPMHGRGGEIGKMLELWSRVNEGQFQTVLLMGEAGIGKSRLVEELREQVESAPHTWFDMQCSQFTSGSAFQPLIELQRNYFEIRSTHSESEGRDSLISSVEALPHLQAVEVIPYLLALHQLPSSEKYPMQQISGGEQRERTIRAIFEFVNAIAHEIPVVLVLEDLHWSDPSTLEFMNYLIRNGTNKRLMLLMTSRPSSSIQWELPHVTQILLTKLSSKHTREMIRHAAGAELPESVLSELESRSDGVPLFISELTSNVVGSSEIVEQDGSFSLNVDMEKLAIPTTLQDSLMAKLDKLGDSKIIAQHAATLGREFTYEELKLVSNLDTTYLDSALRNLVDQGVVREEGVVPESNYIFKHALLQDAAYESQLFSTRREIHTKVVDALERNFPQRVSAEPEVIARHCVAADMQEKAVDYYHSAATLAEKRLSNEEAYNHYELALKALNTIESDMSRHQREIALRLAQNKAQASLHGFDSPLIQVNIKRIEELSDSFVEQEQKLPALMGLVEFDGTSGNLLNSKDRAKELLDIGESIDLPLAVAVATLALGGVASESGFVNVSKERYKMVSEMPVSKLMPPPATNSDPEFLSLVLIAYASTIAALAEFDECISAINESIQRAKNFGNDYTLATVYAMASMCGYLNFNFDLAKQNVDKAIELGEGRGFHSSLTMAKIVRGWVRAMAGEYESGIADTVEGLENAQRTGVIPAMPLMHRVAAETYSLSGDHESSLRQVDVAIAEINRNGSIGYMPWALNTKARIKLASNNFNKAEIEAMLLESFALGEEQHSRYAQFEAATLLAEIVDEDAKIESSYLRLKKMMEPLEDYPDSAMWANAKTILEKLSTRISKITIN